MAKSNNLQTITLEAGQDLSAKQYYFVSIAADGQVDPSGDGARVDGVLQNDPSAAGQAADVAIAGVSKVVAGAAITRGDKVSSDASGKANTAASTDEYAGIALAAAAADGDVIPVLLKLAVRSVAP